MVAMALQTHNMVGIKSFHLIDYKVWLAVNNDLSIYTYVFHQTLHPCVKWVSHCLPRCEYLDLFAIISIALVSILLQNAQWKSAGYYMSLRNVKEITSGKVYNRYP